MTLVEFKREATADEVRRFSCFWLPACCLLLSAVSLFRFASKSAAVAFLAIGVASVLLGLLRPRVMRAAFLVGTWVTFPIGWLVAHVAVGAIYFLLITPIALVLRATGRDPLQRKFDPNRSTYWTQRPQPEDRNRYFRQF